MTKFASKNANSKMTKEDVLLIRALYLDGKKINTIARQYKVKWSTINDIIKGYTYKHV